VQIVFSASLFFCAKKDEKKSNNYEPTDNYDVYYITYDNNIYTISI